MKRLLSTLALVLLTVVTSYAQCPNDNGPTAPATNFDASSLALGVTQTMTTTAWGGEYVEVSNASVGATYTIDLCGSPDDTYLTVYDQSTAALVGFNDNTCADDGSVTFVAPTAGPFRALVDIGAGCGTAATNHLVRITLDALSTLPVELSKFNVELTRDLEVLLTWETVSELNNQGFDVMHSLNGEDWNKIGFVEGMGNSNEVVHYNYEHRALSSGMNYYRLIQRDVDGTETPSFVQSLDVSEDPTIDLQLLPNPSSGQEVYVRSKAHIESIVVTDNNGRIIPSEFNVDSRMLNVSHLPNGFYSVIVQGEEGEIFVTTLSRY